MPKMKISHIKKFKGAIFDLDGTLVKSSHVWSDIDKKFLGKRGIPVPDDYYKEIAAMNFEQAAEYTNTRFKLNENIADIQNEWFNMAIDEYSNNIVTVEGAEKFLEFLRSENIKIALATASARELYEPVLKHNGIYDYFEFFASTDMVKRGKGFPDVYELACKNLNLLPQECVVFEDILPGIKGAKDGGFYTAACLNSHYMEDFQQMKRESDYWFNNFLEIFNSPRPFSGNDYPKL